MKKPQPSNKSAPTAAAKDGRSTFLEAFKKSPALVKGLKSLVDAKDQNAKPDIADGTYGARVVDVKFGAYNGVPNARLFFKIDKGPYRDVTLQKRYDFGKTKPDSPVSIEEVFERIGIDLERMGADRSSTDPADLLESFEDLKERKPLVQINVKNNNNYLNVYVNRLLESGRVEEEESASHPSASSDEEESEESEEEGSEDESGESSEDEEQVSVEVGDVVTYTPPGQKKPREFQVTMTQPALKVCNLKDGKGATFAAVPWSDVTFVLEEGEG